MKVRELITQLLEQDMDAKVNIRILGTSMPDGECYVADLNSLGDCRDECELLCHTGDFKNAYDKNKSLFDFMKDCEPTGDGTYEFPEYIKYYNERTQ